MKRKFTTLCAGLLLGAGGISAQAQTVAWGTSVSEIPLVYTSNGAADDGGLIWELGWFDDGFTPDATNAAEWYDRWNPVDSGAHENYGTESDPLWAVSENAEDVGAAAESRQEWVFAFNNPALLGTPTGEALLYREVGLTFPALLGQNTFDIANNPNDDADNTFEVVWGRLDREMYNIGGILAGGGEFAVLVPDSDAQPYDSLNGTFEAQSGTWAAVPEPSTAGMILLAGLGAFRRGRRHHSRGA